MLRFDKKMKVYMAMNYLIGDIFIVKEFSLMNLNKMIITEIKHPNLIKVLGNEQINNKYYIYIEYISGGKKF